MEETREKFVYFDQYCDSCKHKDNPAEEEPCLDCIPVAVNTNSHKPVKWEAAE